MAHHHRSTRRRPDRTRVTAPSSSTSEPLLEVHLLRQKIAGVAGIVWEVTVNGLYCSPAFYVVEDTREAALGTARARMMRDNLEWRELYAEHG